MAGEFHEAEISNMLFMDELYQRYKENPESVDPSWKHFFQGMDFGNFLQKGEGERGADLSSCRIFHLIRSYRRFGHRLSQINPIETKEREVPELELNALGFSESELEEEFPTFGFCGKERAPLVEIIKALQQIYGERIGFEYMDLENPEMEKWIQSQIEPELHFNLSPLEKQNILENLNKAHVFEMFLNTKYQGQTRFSVEGIETIIPLLSQIIEEGANLGIELFALGTAHRGRLNILANLLNKPFPIIFKEFEDTISYAFGEMSDVKYHKGYSGDIQTKQGKKVHLILSANSSCLESTDPVVLGQTKAKQILANDLKGERSTAILLHGDAALAGQGVVYEILQMAKVNGFSTGGTIHIAMNNQIGYTTLPSQGRSTRYCTDIAKAFGAPVFHVNAEDPESCIFVAKLSLQLRQKFQCDVFIDLNGYRKFGHNEGDEPSFTQPLQYKIIHSKKGVRELYLEQLMQEGLVEKKIAETFDEDFKRRLSEAFEKGKVEEEVEPEQRYGKMASEFSQPPSEEVFHAFEEKVDSKLLVEVMDRYGSVPENFHLHKKLEKWLLDRKAMLEANEKKIDWGTAECLAIGSLACQGTPIRLVGQDSIRGTFSQRHAGWFDQETGEVYFPFSHLKEGQARVDIYNTILSEYGSLGFEFGYSWSTPKGLIMWEAQYGDFVIGAEIPIDHYIVSSEEKWNRYSSLVLLLPHGYEGAGPEHSSGRMERFLQLAAQNNIQVANLTTPSQYFHLLRRQALRSIKKPLILFTPKSLLRHPDCKSSLEELTKGSFQEFLEEEVKPEKVKKLVLCSGKIYYELLQMKEDLKETLMIRVEQIYPFHKEKFQKIVEKYPEISKCIWIQEEPQNMGAGLHLLPILKEVLPKVDVSMIARLPSGSTATGSRKRHMIEQNEILNALKERIR